jgi:predicted  nucleic acid-binding Zn-ribbon protein
VKAAAADQARLLDVQVVDTAIDQLAHRRSHLAEVGEAEQLVARLQQIRDSLASAEAEESDIGREQVKAEGDVEQVVSRAARDQQRLDAGTVGSPRELENLQSEIASLGRRRAELEDVVLEIMERREDVQTRISGLRRDQEETAAALAEVEQRRDAVLAEIDASSDERRAEREKLASDVPADLMALYEKIRAASAGIGAAALYRGRCEGCRLTLNAAELGAIRDAPDDEVLRCEECRRILVRTAESGL